jgi:hypothetical protein
MSTTTAVIVLACVTVAVFAIANVGVWLVAREVLNHRRRIATEIAETEASIKRGVRRTDHRFEP